MESSELSEDTWLYGLADQVGKECVVLRNSVLDGQATIWLHKYEQGNYNRGWKEAFLRWRAGGTPSDHPQWKKGSIIADFIDPPLFYLALRRDEVMSVFTSEQYLRHTCQLQSDMILRKCKQTHFNQIVEKFGLKHGPGGS